MLSFLVHLTGVYTLIGVLTTIYLYTLDEGRGWEGYTGIESAMGGLFWPWMFRILWRQGDRPWHVFQRLALKLKRNIPR
jgi:hypothetical protein